MNEDRIKAICANFKCNKCVYNDVSAFDNPCSRCHYNNTGRSNNFEPIPSENVHSPPNLHLAVPAETCRTCSQSTLIFDHYYCEKFGHCLVDKGDVCDEYE